MAIHSYCDGFRRREVLKLGLLSGLGGLGLSLPGYLRQAAAGEVSTAKARSAIYIDLTGGPSHMDTFDLKPDAPVEYRGEFNPIDTTVPGVRISEHLPKLAQQAQHFAILRGVSHTVAAHALGRKYMSTGNRPIASLEYPAYSAVVAKELSGDRRLPATVAIPKSEHSVGYLGVRYGALETNAVPKPKQPFSIRGISIGNGVTVADVERRNNLLADLDKTFAGFEKQDSLVAGLDEFHQQVLSMVTSTQAREAFDTGRESPEVAQRFGDHALGQSCLLAARLVGAGVKFVTVGNGGWDTHQNNFANLKDKQLPPLDQALSGLLQTLAERGQLESTLVIVTGEFGRTPKINARGGRDHYPRAMTVVLAGGGVKGGQVLGASNEKAEGPAETGWSPEMVASSIYHALGVDYTKEYQSATGRPLMIVREGSVIPGLFA